MNSIKYYLSYIRAIFLRILKKLGLIAHGGTMVDQILDHVAPFNEYPLCELCGSDSYSEKLKTRDGCRIVECNKCELWYTSPRINENVWIKWLSKISSRSVDFTENRLKYGDALSSNIKYRYPNWRERIARKDKSILDLVMKHSTIPIKRIHDVGCGVGFLMQSAKEFGMEVTGNELNSYACKVMNERLGLTVLNDVFPNLEIKENTIDSIIMHDLIEHTYHPMQDLKTAYRVLRPGGILFVETFHIDCFLFDRYGPNWNMLFWNHVYHFSTKTLHDIILRAGFKIVKVFGAYDDANIQVIARK